MSKDYITCKYCGIVERGHICPYRKDNRKKESTEARRFRSSKRWQSKSEEIRTRDKYLCQVCMSDKYNTSMPLNYKGIEVHHIIPIDEDYNKRLDNDNLISLCSYHHHMAEAGQIPRDELIRLTIDKAGEEI